MNRTRVPTSGPMWASRKSALKIPFDTWPGRHLGLRAGVNKEGGVLRVPKGLDEVDGGGGANIHQAGGHCGYVLGVIVDGGSEKPYPPSE